MVEVVFICLQFPLEISETQVIAVIGFKPAVKYSFVEKGKRTRLKVQYKAELTSSPRLYVKPLTTAINESHLLGLNNDDVT